MSIITQGGTRLECPICKRSTMHHALLFPDKGPRYYDWVCYKCGTPTKSPEYKAAQARREWADRMKKREAIGP